MNVSFNCIAFQLQFSSDQIDTVYSLLELSNRGDYIVPAFILKQQIGYNLPQKFKEWLERADENVNIVFEQRVLSTSKKCFNDWELIDF
jgi:hypothetical protein